MKQELIQQLAEQTKQMTAALKGKTFVETLCLAGEEPMECTRFEVYDFELVFMSDGGCCLKLYDDSETYFDNREYDAVDIPACCLPDLLQKGKAEHDDCVYEILESKEKS